MSIADAGPGPPGTGRVLRGAFINNMPDGAFVETEAQFLGLLQRRPEEGLVAPVEVRRYAMSGVPRGPQVAAYQRAGYLPLEQLWEGQPDLVIVTGSEPLAAALPDEPYWAELVDLVEQAAARPTALLLSCLAAHGALEHLDGIRRRRLASKCSGVFAHELAPGSPLTAGMGRPALMPHSRVNDVPTEAVVAAGWKVVMSSTVGWGTITARRGQADMLLLQGHPEYAPAQLLREYRRDLRRYLAGERSVPPDVPVGCVGPADLAPLARFHRAALAGRAGLDNLDWDRVAARAPGPWRGVAESLFTNWVAGVTARVRTTSAAGPPRL